MPTKQNAKKQPPMGVGEVAALLGVTDRQVRNWIKDKGLPAKSDSRGFSLKWPDALEWYVGYRSAQTAGNGGNRAHGAGQNAPEVPEETYDQALTRKTKAEADLKELQLARERTEVAAIADVEKALTNANAATRTLIQALPSRLSTQLLGLTDRTQLHAILERETNGLLGNLATVKAVLEVGAKHGAPEDEE